MSLPGTSLWQRTMSDEMATHLERQTWDLLKVRATSNVAVRTWAYNYKHDADGVVNRYRARFCLCGFTQSWIIDYEEVYAPYPAKATVRAFMAVVPQQELEARVNPRHHQHLPERAQLEGPVRGTARGIRARRSIGSVKLQPRYIYGAKQPGNLWSVELNATMTMVGAESTNADPNIFLWYHPEHGLIITLEHGDDALTVAETLNGVAAGKAVLSRKHKLRGMGELKNFLGLGIERNHSQCKLFLSAPRHATALLRKNNTEHAIPTKVPIPSSTTLQRGSSGVIGDCRQLPVPANDHTAQPGLRRGIRVFPPMSGQRHIGHTLQKRVSSSPTASSRTVINAKRARCVANRGQPS